MRTHAGLAYDVLLYTGLRCGDAAKLGRRHIRNGVITIRKETTGELVTVPVLPPLARSIELPTGEVTFMISAYNGKAFTKE